MTYRIKSNERVKSDSETTRVIRPWGSSGIACILVVLAFVSFSLGCGSTEETQEELEQAAYRPPPPRGLVLAPSNEDIGTVQVYRTGSETAPPIITMGTEETITVEFDLLSNETRTFSIYFYHANRGWERDLIPVEYLRTFSSDQLINYRLSRSTDVPYAHYEYEFPSSNIDFTLSGNYILRVTEMGDEENVLFERPFFITEQAALIELTLDRVLVPGQPYSSIQPLARFQPPGPNQNIYDYSMCFVRNDRYGAARCARSPSLAAQPGVAFLLDPRQSFQLAPPPSFLNLSEVRVGGNIEFVDRSVSPPEAALEPDYARFPGSAFGPFLNGQSVVREAVREHLDPEISSEYVRVFFRYVPVDERPASGRVIVAGSFNNWRRDPDNALIWMPENNWYEGDILIKQGHHEYVYLVDDPVLQRAASGAPPANQSLYSAFLYFSDITAHTDRLVSVRGLLAN